MFSINVLFYLGIISIIGLSILLYLDKFLITNPNKNMIMITIITIILNIMILTFCIISFSKVKFESGSIGPVGIRGPRGLSGQDAGLKVCGNAYINAGERKMQIKQKLSEDRPRKPLIIEN